MGSETNSSPSEELDHAEYNVIYHTIVIQMTSFEKLNQKINNPTALQIKDGNKKDIKFRNFYC